MSPLFALDAVLFTFLGYPMTVLEFSGTILNVLCVWLLTRRSIWNWPVGLVAVVLFGILFYRIRLYSDVLEQAYYFGTGVWGWWLWAKKTPDGAATLKLSWSPKTTNLAVGAGIAAGTGALGWLMSRIHVLWPVLFPAPASLPYLDAFTTSMSFAAQLLMAYKRVENWVLWIVVDVISVALYWYKDVRFVSVLYFAFLLLAFKGLRDWRRELALQT